jgi:hypothetical protein
MTDVILLCAYNKISCLSDDAYNNNWTSQQHTYSAMQRAKLTSVR